MYSYQPKQMSMLILFTVYLFTHFKPKEFFLLFFYFLGNLYNCVLTVVGDGMILSMTIYDKSKSRYDTEYTIIESHRVLMTVTYSYCKKCAPFICRPE